MIQQKIENDLSGQLQFQDAGRIKNLQKASAFHHCHYTKETLLRQQKTDSLKKNTKTAA
jgi:hypothetical protein